MFGFFCFVALTPDPNLIVELRLGLGVKSFELKELQQQQRLFLYFNFFLLFVMLYF
jgi:hypothetical protein